MRQAIYVTHVLATVFGGVIVGGLLFGSTQATIWGVVLLILDAIVGICLQAKTDPYEKILAAYIQSSDSSDDDDDEDDEDEDEDEDDEYEDDDDEYEDGDEYDEADDELVRRYHCIKLEWVYQDLMAAGGARIPTNCAKDDAYVFLQNVIQSMPAAYLLTCLPEPLAITVENLNGKHALVYAFPFNSQLACETVYIFLVHDTRDTVRLFAVETAGYGPGLALCEYTEENHILRGFVEASQIPKEIAKLLFG